MKFSSTKTIALLAISIAVLMSSTSCTRNAEVKDNDAKARKALVGVWRGEGGYEGAENVGWKESWKMTRTDNGEYSVEYLATNDAEKLYERSSDSGTWKYENGVYTETNKNDYQITYTVYSVKNDWFEYNLTDRDSEQHIKETKTEEAYQLQKPPEDYSVVNNEQSLSDVIENVADQVDESINKAVKQAVEELAK